MLRVFQNDLLAPDRFVVTLELVPGRESRGRRVETVMDIARQAFADGRISAVSMTDNPGGNPSLSPDAFGSEIFKIGMDVIIHFTCRDINRVGMESRALQLAMMGMKNILALTGDYTGSGYGGQGAPVFDLDSVNLLAMLQLLSDRMRQTGDPDEFFTGCAVSPFKRTEGETFAQYAKLCRKAAAGARFVITQLGYDARKFEELMRVQALVGIDLPVLGSVYVLNPKTAHLMNQGKIPGAVVTDDLLARIRQEWIDPEAGRNAAEERAARLAAVLKGLGYRGIHIGGVHRSFAPVARILDRMAQIQDRWPAFMEDFDFPLPNGFYAFERNAPGKPDRHRFGEAPQRLAAGERLGFRLMRATHRLFFDPASPAVPLMEKFCRWIDQRHYRRFLFRLAEDPMKKILLGCRRCGDCAIEHVGYLCPESGCAKHIRNGACGGSRNGMCEVFPDRPCVWERAYRRWACIEETAKMADGCVPPRMWELDRTPSWLNFYLRRDHHGASTELARFCRARQCRIDASLAPHGSS
jgi:methylenetetrahydrofolate reductase (NADPH)